jgi:hypothetical protein
MGDKEEVSVKLKVMEAKDLGFRKARISSDTMNKLGITVGDVIEIKGEKTTAAKAYQSYPEERELEIIRTDGFTRRNCGASIGELVSVRRVEAKNAKAVKLAPVDIRISVDSDFFDFTKEKIIDMPMITGDVFTIMMLGHAVLFTVFSTDPEGIVKISNETNLIVLSESISEEKRRLRFKYLKDIEEKYAADETWFYIKNSLEEEQKHRSMDEREIIKLAKQIAKNEGKTVEIRVELLEKRGLIEPEGFQWAEVEPSGDIRYTYQNIQN